MAKRDKTQQGKDRRRIAATKPNCYICGSEIDFALKTPDPMSYELDHIIPIARGGSDHISNKAASHRQCNSKKRAREYAPIIRRSTALNR